MLRRPYLYDTKLVIGRLGRRMTGYNQPIRYVTGERHEKEQSNVINGSDHSQLHLVLFAS